MNEHAVSADEVASILVPIQNGGALPPEPDWNGGRRPERPDLFPLLVIGGAYVAAVVLRFLQLRFRSQGSGGGGGG